MKKIVLILLLTAVPVIHVVATDYNSMLVRGVNKRDIAIVRKALMHGADPNMVIKNDFSKLTPFINAVGFGYYKIVSLMLKFKADIHTCGAEKFTALHSVCELCGNYDKEYYAKKGIVIRQQNRLQIVKLLIAKGARLNTKMDDGRTALHLAINNNCNRIARLLIKHMRYHDVKDNKGTTPLRLAAENNNEAIVKLLLTRGAVDFNYKKKYGTVLHCVARYGFAEAIDYLITVKKMSINLLDKDRNSPLMYAAASGRNKVVKYLIANGADIALKNDRGESVLQVAARHGKTATVALLLRKGMNINKKDKYGDTPLHIAIKYRNVKMVKFLVEHGARIHIKNGWKKTPLENACKNWRKTSKNIICNLVRTKNK